MIFTSMWTCLSQAVPIALKVHVLEEAAAEILYTYSSCSPKFPLYSNYYWIVNSDEISFHVTFVLHAVFITIVCSL